MIYCGTNNSRKMHHKPLHRKCTKGKRCVGRNKASEAVQALLDYFEGR